MNRTVIINNQYKPSKGNVIFEFLLGTFVYALIILISSTIFKNFYIESFWYALLASVIVNIFNITIKPFLIFLTLPLTIITLGISYPIVNLIILKLTSLLMGDYFIIEGFFVPLIISVFISILKIAFDKLIVKPIVRGNI